MKVVILAGGYGTRISEESHLRPKPMIEIGQRPILWHIMKQYSHHGFNDFVICLGYKGFYIKEYFAHYFLHESDVTFDFRSDNQLVTHNHTAEPWKVTLVNTGIDTMTGGRVKRIQEYIGNETFMLTYGDGVSNVDIKELVRHHKLHGRLATVTTVQPSGRFGALDITANNQVNGFQEKPKGDGSWINAGFFVLEPDVFKYISSDETVFEKEPLEQLASDGELMGFRHEGFWQPMDTLRDRNYLEELWKTNNAPWKTWDMESVKSK
ncbi:glucose-1-phosphate cytidylyltransferase [Paenibacillus sp. HN-1]|uniref:glucose-1-phosphate cytidylyltransferase n=1 Tax=Paenibacillus TaxID=44249 RepID=UPI001CA7C609|nr:MULTISPECIES: glucose-1-phosphate cytidylyltransferase [Paenibacillus]MBY9077518.1 glucose-1-phosphate cytidylyltransferase [Paenibacillus sp. CGMCC 1.18879]MBY9086404.1 glucose-1-phosphate cytidylyltransferase [Paenibacillus sinensis]